MAQVVNKKFFLLVLIFMFSLSFACSVCFAQENEQDNSQITYQNDSELEYTDDLDETSTLSEDNKDIIQNFTWDVVEYISKYSFIIEMLDENTNEYLQFTDPIETTENKVELILPYGKFRYKIEVYNILDFFEYETDWYYTEIIQTYQPELRDVTPGIIYLEEEQDGIFTLSGAQLRPETRFVLENIRLPGSTTLTGELVEDDSRFRRVKVKIDPTLFDSGTYQFRVINNGGLYDTYSPIKIQFKKPMDFDISVGFAPTIFLFDDTINSYFENNFYPMFGNIRLTFIPVKKRIGYFGASLYGSYGLLSTALLPNDTSFFDEHHYSISSQMLNAHIDFTFQKFLYKRKLVMDLHLGAGVMGFVNMKFKFMQDSESTPFTSLNLTVNGGMALQYYILKRCYIECGCDFTYAFPKLFNGSQMQLGFLQPTIQIGWQF